MEQQLRDLNVPPEQRERMLDQLRHAEAMQQRAQEEAEQRVHERLRGENRDPTPREEKEGAPGQSRKPDKADTLDKADKADKPAAQDKPATPEVTQKQDKPEKQDKADKKE